MEEEPNYYSISFEYKHEVRGISGEGIHISFAVDEERESRRLTNAMDIVCGVLDRLNLDSRHEYAWPDGSLLRFVRTTYGLIELSMILQAHLKGMPFHIAPLSALYPHSYGDPETLEEFFGRVLSEKGQQKKSLIAFVAGAFQ